MNKRGKELKMDLSTNYNVVYGTVDNKNVKSIYINISAWGEPTKKEELNYNRIISNLSKRIKQSIYNYLKCNYSDRFLPERSIIDLDMRESGIKYGKRSFMKCEITIYQKEINEMINEGKTPKLLTEITESAMKCLDDFVYFDFHKKKK